MINTPITEMMHSFFGKDLNGVTIEGEGIIDGVNCYNPKGEKGFSGPHCIKLINCKTIKLEGFSIKNSANWAINYRYCSQGIETNVTSFNQINLRKVTLSKKGTAPILDCNSGNTLILERVSYISDNPSESYTLDKIGRISHIKNKSFQINQK